VPREEKFPFWDGEKDFKVLLHGRQLAKKVSVPDFSGSDAVFETD